MREITVQELIDAGDVLVRVADLGDGFHAQHPDAANVAQMSLVLGLARLYLVDLAKGMADGMALDDAALSMIAGTRQLTSEQQQAFDDAQRLGLN